MEREDNTLLKAAIQKLWDQNPCEKKFVQGK